MLKSRGSEGILPSTTKMADLGAIEPRFDLLIAALVIGVALVAVALGIAPTAWWLHRRSVASALSEQGR
jgi:hypothetical protein